MEALQGILLALSVIFLPLWFVYVVMIVTERFKRNSRDRADRRR